MGEEARGRVDPQRHVYHKKECYSEDGKHPGDYAIPAGTEERTPSLGQGQEYLLQFGLLAAVFYSSRTAPGNRLFSPYFLIFLLRVSLEIPSSRHVAIFFHLFRSRA